MTILALAAMGGDLASRPIAPRVVRRIYAVYRTGSCTRPSMAAALELLRETAQTVGVVPSAAVGGLASLEGAARTGPRTDSGGRAAGG